MTIEEAKKLLEKEGFYVRNVGKPFTGPDSFYEYESPEVVSAINVLRVAGYGLSMECRLFDERKARLKKEYEEHRNEPISRKKERNEENPALKESASQLNDALLDEQAREIGRLRKKIARLSKIIHKKEQMVKDKNAVLSDVAEELRLSKIREKNLTELCQKYMKENEELKVELLQAKLYTRILLMH